MRIDIPSIKSIFFRLHKLNIYDNPTKINFVKKLGNIFFSVKLSRLSSYCNVLLYLWIRRMRVSSNETACGNDLEYFPPERH